MDEYAESYTRQQVCDGYCWDASRTDKAPPVGKAPETISLPTTITLNNSYCMMAFKTWLDAKPGETRLRCEKWIHRQKDVFVYGMIKQMNRATNAL